MENGDEHDTSMTHGRSSSTLPNQCYSFRNINHCRLPAESEKARAPATQRMASSVEASLSDRGLRDVRMP